jgi:hypothetical protein
MALFTADMHFVVYMNATDPKLSMELHSRETPKRIKRYLHSGLSRASSTTSRETARTRSPNLFTRSSSRLGSRAVAVGD